MSEIVKHFRRSRDQEPLGPYRQIKKVGAL